MKTKSKRPSGAPPKKTPAPDTGSLHPACYATANHVAKLTMPYVVWRFLYWMKADLSYTQIDEAVNSKRLVPCDCQVA